MIKSTNWDASSIFACACLIAVVILLFIEWGTTEKSHSIPIIDDNLNSSLQNKVDFYNPQLGGNLDFLKEDLTVYMPPDNAPRAGMVIRPGIDGQLIWVADDSSDGFYLGYANGHWHKLEDAYCIEDDLPDERDSPL